jgi:hypothetical protein
LGSEPQSATKLKLSQTSADAMTFQAKPVLTFGDAEIFVVNTFLQVGDLDILGLRSAHIASPLFHGIDWLDFTVALANHTWSQICDFIPH